MWTDSQGHSIDEHDVVVLLRDLPEDGLESGRIGTVVHRYEGANAYEVEFRLNDAGRGVVATVEAPVLLRLRHPGLALRRTA